MSAPAEYDTHTVTGRGVLAVVGLWLAGAAILATTGYLTVASVTHDVEAPTLTAVRWPTCPCHWQPWPSTDPVGSGTDWRCGASAGAGSD